MRSAFRYRDLDFEGKRKRKEKTYLAFYPMEDMAFTHGAVCLPVHDSIIVTQSNEAMARKILIEAFRAEAGIPPILG